MHFDVFINIKHNLLRERDQVLSATLNETRHDLRFPKQN